MAAKKPGRLVLNHVLLNVKNVAKSKEFYVRKLGLKKISADADYVSVRTPNNVYIGLHGGHNKASRKPWGTELYFQVGDADAWYERLRKKGVRFTQRPKNMPWGSRLAFLKDPDGHLLGISGPLKTK